MNEHIKQHMMRMAVEEVELLLSIIGDLGFDGYKICMCKLHGNSYQQCSNKFNIPKSSAQRYWEKCTQNEYDIALKKIFGLK